MVGSPDDSGRGVVALDDSGGGVVACSPWILFGVRGLKDSGTVAAVLSMIQAVNRCGFSSWERLRRCRGRFA